MLRCCVHGVPNVYKSVNKQMESLPLIAMFLFSNLLIKANRYFVIRFYHMHLNISLFVWAFFSPSSSSNKHSLQHNVNPLCAQTKTNGNMMQRRMAVVALLHETDSQTSSNNFPSFALAHSARLPFN